MKPFYGMLWLVVSVLTVLFALNYRKLHCSCAFTCFSKSFWYCNTTRTIYYADLGWSHKQ